MIVRMLAHVFMAKVQASKARHENHELRRRVSFLENQISRIRDERDEARAATERSVKVREHYLKINEAITRDNIRLASERDHERDVNRRARAAANVTSKRRLEQAAEGAGIPVWSYGSPHNP